MNQKLTDYARRFAKLKAEYEEQDEKLKAIGKEWEACELEMLEAMGDEGVNSMKIEGLGLFTMRVENYLSLNAAKKPQGYAYLKESGNGSLLKEEVNPRTLTAFLKGHLEDVIRKYEGNGLDQVDARKSALDYLNAKGFSYFTKRGLALKKA